MRIHISPPRRLGRERGVTLIVALVVLVIIGLTSAAVMRGALSTDVVANNNRTQTLAMQAAQIGLRYCEIQADNDAKGTPASLPLAYADNYWYTLENWATKGTGIYEVPSDYMESENSTFTPTALPECMVKQIQITPGKTGYQVTARGFSPDYTESGGFTETGSVVWLQSVIYFN